MPKRILSGVVVSSNSNKTIIVDVKSQAKAGDYKNTGTIEGDVKGCNDCSSVSL